MKQAKLTVPLSILASAAVAYLLVLKPARAAAASLANGLNPTSDENIAYRATNAIGGAVTGERDWSLGVAIYEWQVRRRRMALIAELELSEADAALLDTHYGSPDNWPTDKNTVFRTLVSLRALYN